MNYRILSAGLIVLGLNLSVFSQSVVISESANPIPEGSAILDIQSTTKGFLPPRLTFNQRTAMQFPVAGLVVYDTDMNKLYVYAGDFWAPVVSGDHWLLSEENHLFYNSGNVGIGTGFDLPAALLHVNGTGAGEGNVLFTGQWNGVPGPAPALGGGTRLMWYPDKAAFRAGGVSGTQWNTENIGNYSSATGYNSTASGWYSKAWGSVTTASGSQSTAWGFNTSASGTSATAWGENTTAPSFAETVFGYNNTPYTPASSNSWVATDRLFVIGNGSSGSSDALVMLKNGNLGLGDSNPSYRIDATGTIYSFTLETTPAIIGETGSAANGAVGVRGYASSSTTGGGSAGVQGRNFATNNFGYGVRGTHDSGGWGVYGESVSGRGVNGNASSSTGITYGVYGRSSSPDGFAVYGINNNTNSGGLSIGAQFESVAENGVALRAIALTTGSSSFGVIGRVYSQWGDAVFGDAGETTGGRGIWGIGPDFGDAGYFSGDVFVTDNFAVNGTKSFTIDHPHDPSNKFLSHFCIEGPEPFNLYRGTVTLDESGSSWVILPDYFEAINIDFSYQLTAIGAPMPNLHVAAPISDGKFQVTGGAPGKQVSWEVTARRNDPWVRDKGYQAERAKPEHERGTYIYPQGYGQPEEMQRDYKRIQMARGTAEPKKDE